MPRESAEFDVSSFEDTEEANNKGVHARFYMVPKEDPAKSAEEGRPIFTDREYVEIVAAGNANNIIRRPATDMDKDRFRRQYAAFKAGDHEQIIGTPLSEVPWLTRTQVEELMYRKIRTLEALAEVSDQNCNAPGMYNLRTKAQEWLKKAEGAKPFTAIMKKMEEMEKQIEQLKAERDTAVAANKTKNG